MSNNKLDDLFIFTESLEHRWEIDESETGSVVDGNHIIGRVKGPFFAVDGESRNGRFYSRGLWEKAINENTDRMTGGTMLGAVGHDQPINDEALREGKISHRVTKLWIDDAKKVGMGEVLIFNTPSGQILNTYMRGGVPIAVSSRADGQYSGKTASGAQIVNEQTFALDTFDFVLKPGITHAVPSIVESEVIKPDNVDIIIETKDDVMSQQLLESLASDKASLQIQLSEALTSIDTVKGNNAALQQATDSYKRDVARLEESLVAANAKVTASDAEKTSLQSELSVYRELGEPVEVKNALTESKTILEQYEEFGTVSELTTAFDEAKTLINDYSELGSPDEIEQVLETIEAIAEVGTVEEIKESLELLTQYKELGTVAEVNTLLDVSSKYADLGSPDTITEAFDTMNTLVTKFDEENKAKEALGISKEYGVKKEIVESMLEKHGKTETVSLLEALKVDPVSDRYRAPADSEIKLDESLELNEDSPVESRAARLMRTRS
jgi:hypothetical protein